MGELMWTIDSRQQVISTRWVVADETERVEGRETKLVRCRTLARDYGTGPSAAQLGLSSPTASAETLRVFLTVAGARGTNINGLNVIAAFLFAHLDKEEVVVSLPEGCRGAGKALYGLGSAALHWTKHLSKVLDRLFVPNGALSLLRGLLL